MLIQYDVKISYENKEKIYGVNILTIYNCAMGLKFRKSKLYFCGDC